MITLLLYENSPTDYLLKVKLFTNLYSVPGLLLSQNTWHFISIRVACNSLPHSLY